jgi:hypothetical protein
MLDHVRSEHNTGNGLDVAPSAGSPGVRVTVVDSSFTNNEGKGIGGDTVGGSTLTILVERSVMSYNGQDGFAATAEAGASVVAALTRNAINDNGGNGIWLQAFGNAKGALSENTLHRNAGNGIRVDGGGTSSTRLSANSAVGNLAVAADVWCSTGNMITAANNVAEWLAISCTYGKDGGW